MFRHTKKAKAICLLVPDAFTNYAWQVQAWNSRSARVLPHLKRRTYDDCHAPRAVAEQ